MSNPEHERIFYAMIDKYNTVEPIDCRTHVVQFSEHQSMVIRWEHMNWTYYVYDLEQFEE